MKSTVFAIPIFPLIQTLYYNTYLLLNAWYKNEYSRIGPSVGSVQEWILDTRNSAILVYVGSEQFRNIA